MPPGGVHLLLGILIGTRLRRPALVIGFIFSMILPDIDLVASVATFLATGNTEMMIYVHRSLTHSAVLFLPIAVIGLLLTFLRKKPPITRSVEAVTETASETVNPLSTLGPFLLAVGVGMGLHAVFDLFYFSSVRIFFPVLTNELILSPTTYEAFPVTAQKAWSSLDLMCDAVAYLVVWRWARKFGTDRRRQRLLLVVGIVALIYLGTLSFIAFTAIGLETFVFVVYILGVFIVPFSVFLPLLMRRTLVWVCMPPTVPVTG